MNRLLLLVFASAVLAVSACSRKSDQTKVKPNAANAQRLKSDSERLQQATANAAKAREKEAQAHATPSPTP